MAEEQQKARRRAPKGYEKKNTDPVGYWTEDGPIHFVPRGVKLIDGTRVKERPSIMIVGELVEPTIVALKDGDPFEAKLGDIVSVWYKPGMRDIAKNGNIKVWLDKDLGEDGVQLTKPTKNGDMKLYTVAGEPGKKGILIPISEDSRVRSVAAKTPFDDPNMAALPRRAPPKVETEVDEEEPVDDNIPF